jgi:hypothetical protein
MRGAPDLCGRLVVATLGLALALACCDGQMGDIPPTGPAPPGRDGGAAVDRPPIIPMDGPGPGLSGRAQCWDLAWACWPMPNPAAAGLPNPARYQVPPGDPTIVIDEVTTLMWQRTPFNESTLWQTAKERCAGLPLGGASDWRLPTRIELLSLVDFTQAGAAIEGGFFPETRGAFWTSSPATGGDPTARAWQISFADGGATTTASQTTAGAIRCVRAMRPPGQPAARYNITGLAPDEIVTDLGTGLQWQRAAGDATFTFDEAQAHCAALPLAGGDWRVPSVKELQTLVDDAKTAGPYIDQTVFAGTPAGRAPFWTSSPSAAAASAAWFVDFATGEAAATAAVSGDLVDQLHQVRCVR